MTDQQIVNYLREHGYAEHIWRGGREGLVRRWQDFVADVERGYPLGLEDYRNELDLRAAIAGAGLDQDVREADERFENMLVRRHKRVWDSAPGDPFWDFGYPKNASGDLLDDLRAEGLA